MRSLFPALETVVHMTWVAGNSVAALASHAAAEVVSVPVDELPVGDEFSFVIDQE